MEKALVNENRKNGHVLASENVLASKNRQKGRMLVTGSRNGESIERLKKMIHGTSEEDDDEQGV